MHRVGVIPFDVQDNVIALLFVTSQTRGRWILPKGGVKKGERHEDACLREAFEEAGVKGELLGDFPITVSIQKQGETSIEKVPVTYYPLLVTEQLNKFPEKDRRQRHWALLKDARKVVYNEDYLKLVTLFDDLQPFIKEAVSGRIAKRTKALTPAQ